MSIQITSIAESRALLLLVHISSRHSSVRRNHHSFVLTKPQSHASYHAAHEEWHSATPGGRLAGLYGPEMGPFTVPSGAGEGTELDIADPVIGRRATADGMGEAVITATQLRRRSQKQRLGGKVLIERPWETPALREIAVVDAPA